MHGQHPEAEVNLFRPRFMKYMTTTNEKKKNNTACKVSILEKSGVLKPQERKEKYCLDAVSC